MNIRLEYCRHWISANFLDYSFWRVFHGSLLSKDLAVLYIFRYAHWPSFHHHKKSHQKNSNIQIWNKYTERIDSLHFVFSSKVLEIKSFRMTVYTTAIIVYQANSKKIYKPSNWKSVSNSIEWKGKIRFVTNIAIILFPPARTVWCWFSHCFFIQYFYAYAYVYYLAMVWILKFHWL